MCLPENKMFEMTRKFKQLNIAEKLGLIPQSEMIVLQTVIGLSENGEKSCRVSDIARKLMVSPPAISRTIKKLREKQYVECIINEADRRNTYIAVTETGTKALISDMKKMNAFTKNVMSHLSEEEIEKFQDIYNKIYEGIKEELEKNK